MKIIDHIYINGEFVKPNGMEVRNLINPATAEMMGQVTLGNIKDTQDAIAPESYL